MLDLCKFYFHVSVLACYNSYTRGFFIYFSVSFTLCLSNFVQRFVIILEFRIIESLYFYNIMNSIL